MDSATLLDYVHVAVETIKCTEQHVQNALKPALAEIMRVNPLEQQIAPSMPFRIESFTEEGLVLDRQKEISRVQVTSYFDIHDVTSSESKFLRKLRKLYNRFCKQLKSEIQDRCPVSVIVEPVKVWVSVEGPAVKVSFYTLRRFNFYQRKEREDE